jgi:pyruvate/2-oxoglutarate/acetoin dehydrogenase E1 component
MKKMKFTEAIDSAIAQEMADNQSIIILGEDVHALRSTLFARFGKERVKSTPISEAAFLGASVTASMLGLRPVVEIMLVDFIAVAMDSLVNHAAKNTFFSGGKWETPLVIRTSCGGWYGDAGQHEQSFWGWLSHIPGLTVVVPSNPVDAGALMIAALRYNSPVIFMEHKMLAENWYDYMASGGRKTIKFDRPLDGIEAEVPEKWEPITIGSAKIIKEGSDVSLITVGLSVHHCVEVAKECEKEGIRCEIVDLRTVKPLDLETIKKTALKTKKIIVVDEDYREFGLSGEIAAILLENHIQCKFARVCTTNTIPYSLKLEYEILPNKERIKNAIKEIIK